MAGGSHWILSEELGQGLGRAGLSSQTESEKRLGLGLILGLQPKAASEAPSSRDRVSLGPQHIFSLMGVARSRSAALASFALGSSQLSGWIQEVF